MRQEQSISYGKLVRDRIPEIIEADGRTAKVRVLEESEVLPALMAKLSEEVEELHRAEPGDRLGELADVYEVLVAVAGAGGFSEEEVREAALRKRVERGGFGRRLWLEEVTSHRRAR
ncbi:phosphoribosyl-ATP pyrophosphohydrolase [Sphaerisporangium krabiense]|uniref:Putative house-cleaning noncanonical NTP pyrophosphatase (MazG superfamily) n=1 Tax=Sphaerisporangium krabiense TaxID=763782 RepID=A0A7W8Z6W9_9ACTN|nr:nucleoside triphosphate pyrophosphohydrolase [Sphaerisporangium krabiense]MBB5628460.1 putative house-cleaning noncanonical NTP pyrophosphatase (MazG superfamily) [Sphaerisporangium krabiense]GII66801.1 phosphoribosyl-ATP pyrophosphohydrolase [Sphaerisporangium krabiense]